jgi:4-hydroxy-2-oxoglutarate aldolase
LWVAVRYKLHPTHDDETVMDGVPEELVAVDLMAMLIDGIHIPLTVPFTRDGESYLRKLEYNVGRYSLTPAAGMVALTSEGGALSDEEIGEALRVIGAAAATDKVLVAAIAKDSVRGSLAIAEQAEVAGFDAVLLGAPPQWKRLSGNELMMFFRAVADASPLPVMLSSDVGAYQISVDVIAELAGHQNVIGLYDDGVTLERYRAIVAATQGVKHEVVVTTVFAPATRRVLRGRREAADVAGFVTAEALAGGKAVAIVATAPALKTRTKTVGFQVMAAGSARGVVELLEAGVAGAMLGLSACAPQGCYEAYAAFKDGDPALAAEKGQRLVEADAVIREMGVAGIKYGCDWNGYYGGAPRLPRLPLDVEGRARVEKVLAGIRN